MPRVLLRFLCCCAQARRPVLRFCTCAGLVYVQKTEWLLWCNYVINLKLPTHRGVLPPCQWNAPIGLLFFCSVAVPFVYFVYFVIQLETLPPPCAVGSMILLQQGDPNNLVLFLTASFFVLFCHTGTELASLAFCSRD